MVTLNDIAAQLGVSVTTVSRVINDKSEKYRISKKTESRIKQVVEELGYKPNILARGLRLKKSQSIGLVVPDISNPFFAFVTKVIQTYAHAGGYSLIVCNTDENIESEIEQIDLLRSKGVDGFIILPVGTESGHIQSLLDQMHPLVLLDRCFDSVNTNSVLVDNYIGAYEAISYTVNKGHKKIAIIKGLSGTYTTDERVRGYRQALIDNNIKIDERFIVGKNYGIENGYLETKLLLSSDKKPTAIFSTGDLITVGVLKAIKEEGLNIPEDISLISFDDTDFAPYLASPLTVIRQPKDLMGQMAIKMIIDTIKNKNSESSKIILKPKLIERNSVKSLY